MFLTGMKDGFPASFHHEQAFSVKLKAKTFWVLSRNSIFFKTPKNLYTTTKRLTDIEYRPHRDEI
jgi:hypothetical protein